MASTQANFFSRLHKWASRQDENFLTESLATTLQIALEREPIFAARVLKRLSCGFFGDSPDGKSIVEITTQMVTPDGRPDLVIRTPERIAVFEVKVESGLGDTQLERYRRFLSACPQTYRRLFLLTKYSTPLIDQHEKPDNEVRWHDVFDIMTSESAPDACKDPICRYIFQTFAAFLRDRQMAVEKVEWRLIDGAGALQSLLVVLKSAAERCDAFDRYHLKPAYDYYGVKLKTPDSLMGLNTTDAGKLWFETKCKINVEAARSLVQNSQGDTWDVDRKATWGRHLDLNSEVVHFFSLSALGQVMCLEAFLRESLALAKSLEVPGNEEPSDFGVEQ